MSLFFLILHALVCVALVVMILLQHGKGTGLEGMGGGSSTTIFGSRGSASLLVKLTAAFALMFFVTSFSLSYLVPKTQSAAVKILEHK